jgi:hypothetical protein
VVPFKNCVRQRCPVSKVADITKNINFFKCPKLLYFKPESAQIKKLIIILLQFKFGHFLAENKAVLDI